MQRTIVVKMDGFHYDMKELNRLLEDKWHIVSCSPGNDTEMEYLLEKGENGEENEDL